jgi:large subunit ribosomal protein L24
MEKLKVGDTVEVMSGAERSQKHKRGKVLEIDREASRVRVEGLRLVKRHVSRGRDRASPEGGIVEKVGSIALANLALVCPKCSKPTRIGFRLQGDTKSRFCKQCDAIVD